MKNRCFNRACLLAVFGVFAASSTVSQAETVAMPDRELADRLCENALAQKGLCDVAWALSALWLDRDKVEANRRLRAAYAAFLDGAPAMTPAIADEQAKWQMRTWIRVYYLFHSRSAWFPGRLEPETEALIETLFWNYACAKSTVERARPEYVWLIQGSENHDMMDLGNAFLALQAIAQRPEYAERLIPDGNTPKQHVAAWTAYYTLYCKERVKQGLFVEVASPTYGKYLIPELVNIYDFTEDATLRGKLKVLLDVTWADWAVEQLGGVRGGGKARCYQGNYSRDGASDSWRMMGQILLNEGDWTTAKRYTHPIMGFGFILATSRYRLPPLVAELAQHSGDRGEYVYISKRPGRMNAPSALPFLGGHPCWYHMDAEETRLVRYSWCTPDHIMGCFWVDPSLGESTRVAAGKAEEARSRYAAISGQNRWQGIVLATGPQARIFPQCLGRPDKNKPGLSITEIQQIAVQHKNVMIVQTNRAEPSNRAMRIYFAPGMRDRLVHDSGWYFLEEGGSYVGITVFLSEGGDGHCGVSWDDNTFLRLSDMYAPVAFVTGRHARFESLDAFQRYVLGHEQQVRGGVFHYRFEDPDGRQVELSLYLTERHMPEIDGEPLDLTPGRVYDCPFLKADADTGITTVTFKGQRLVCDVTTDVVSEGGGAGS